MVTLDAPKPLLERNPRTRLVEEVLTYFRRGNQLFDQGDLEAASREYHHALALAPNDPTLQNNLAAVLNRLGRDEEALELLEQVLRTSPADDVAWHNMGVTLVKLDRLEEAIAAYDRALQITPNDAGTLANKGLAEAHLGKLREALLDLDRALTQTPDPQVRACRKAVLEELIRSLSTEGVLSWEGGKPAGRLPPAPISKGPPVSDYVIQDRH